MAHMGMAQNQYFWNGLYMGNHPLKWPYKGVPPSYKWVIILLTIDITPINHSEMGLICTNLANELGHHLVD